MTAAPLTIAYPPASLLYFCDHVWPVARPCEPGILADCAVCGLQFAPCTATPLDVRLVLDTAWQCPSCSVESE